MAPSQRMKIKSGTTEPISTASWIARTSPRNARATAGTTLWKTRASTHMGSAPTARSQCPPSSNCSADTAGAATARSAAKEASSAATRLLVRTPSARAELRAAAPPSAAVKHAGPAAAGGGASPAAVVASAASCPSSPPPCAVYAESSASCTSPQPAPARAPTREPSVRLVALRSPTPGCLEAHAVLIVTSATISPLAAISAQPQTSMADEGMKPTGAVAPGSASAPAPIVVPAMSAAPDRMACGDARADAPAVSGSGHSMGVGPVAARSDARGCTRGPPLPGACSAAPPASASSAAATLRLRAMAAAIGVFA
mmetsp:Transcript_14126/g.35871  ORF Transcript_14126/g.35871 Transcript_14126/m.35871 type:complete len:313 (-) Transcript_14126:105-1043(-)